MSIEKFSFSLGSPSSGFSVTNPSHIDPSDEIRQQYESQDKICDLSIICLDGFIKCHSSILYAKSSKNTAFVASGTRDQLKLLLHFLYYGQVIIPHQVDTMQVLFKEFTRLRPRWDICNTLKLSIEKYSPKSTSPSSHTSPSISVSESESNRVSSSISPSFPAQVRRAHQTTPSASNFSPASCHPIIKSISSLDSSSSAATATDSSSTNGANAVDVVDQSHPVKASHDNTTSTQKRANKSCIQPVTCTKLPSISNQLLSPPICRISQKIESPPLVALSSQSSDPAELAMEMHVSRPSNSPMLAKSSSVRGPISRSANRPTKSIASQCHKTPLSVIKVAMPASEAGQAASNVSTPAPPIHISNQISVNNGQSQATDTPVEKASATCSTSEVSAPVSTDAAPLDVDFRKNLPSPKNVSKEATNSTAAREASIPHSTRKGHANQSDSIMPVSASACTIDDETNPIDNSLSNSDTSFDTALKELPKELEKPSSDRMQTSSDKIFVCDVCSKSFRLNVQLNKHKSNHHRGQSGENTSSEGQDKHLNRPDQPGKTLSLQPQERRVPSSSLATEKSGAQGEPVAKQSQKTISPHSDTVSTLTPAATIANSSTNTSSSAASAPSVEKTKFAIHNAADNVSSSSQRRSVSDVGERSESTSHCPSNMERNSSRSDSKSRPSSREKSVAKESHSRQPASKNSSSSNRPGSSKQISSSDSRGSGSLVLIEGTRSPSSGKANSSTSHSKFSSSSSSSHVRKDSEKKSSHSSSSSRHDSSSHSRSSSNASQPNNHSSSSSTSNTRNSSTLDVSSALHSSSRNYGSNKRKHPEGEEASQKKDAPTRKTIQMCDPLPLGSSSPHKRKVSPTEGTSHQSGTQNSKQPRYSNQSLDKRRQSQEAQEAFRKHIFQPKM